jgi:hypothetical protein
MCSNGLFDWLKQIVQPIKKPGRTLSIFMSMAFVKDAKGISFKNRLKKHINWRKVRNFNVIRVKLIVTSERLNIFKKCFHQSKVK